MQPGKSAPNGAAGGSAGFDRTGWATAAGKLRSGEVVLPVSLSLCPRQANQFGCLNFAHSESRQLVDSINQFIKTCYRRGTQNVVNILVFSVKSTIKNFCRRRSDKLDQLLLLMPCFNRHLQPDDSCFRQFIDETKPLAMIDDHRLKIPHACW